MKMPRKTLLKGVKRIVVKVGTSSLTDDDVISKHKIERLAADITGLLSRGYQVVLVTSGAISAGAGALHRQRNSLTIPERQALASVGQAILIDEYRHCFQGRGYAVGQILLTEDDVKHRRRFLNARHTMEALLEMKVIPIVNENDTVVVKEIKFGDNDTLSAHVASLVDADLLILLSDIDGFYWSLKDPEPVDEIRKITAEVTERAGGSGSIGGTGGMVTKLRAAEMMMRFGEKLIIANSSTPGILNRIMDGEKLGPCSSATGRSSAAGRNGWPCVKQGGWSFWTRER
jgi:glutamate 5-kinase